MVPPGRPAASFDHGASFSQASSLIPHVAGNWGDRDFIAAGRGGTVYVTWDYGPSAADVKIVCSPSGSCAYAAVDATAVVQKSTDHGKTWGPITPMQPGFPAGGGYEAAMPGQTRCLILVPRQPNLAVARHGERPLADIPSSGHARSPLTECAQLSADRYALTPRALPK